jgi:hypothetical protein
VAESSCLQAKNVDKKAKKAQKIAKLRFFILCFFFKTRLKKTPQILAIEQCIFAR